MPRLHVLGAAGWIPTLNTQTCCSLLETRRGLVFFDCGTGISRLHDPMFKEIIARNKRSIVLLSHWHHDHIEGLHALPFFLKDHEVIIGAPAASVTGHGAIDVLECFGGPPLLPRPLPAWADRFKGGFSIQELAPGSHKIGGEVVDVIAQPHSDPSIGFRVRDVVYITDTCAREETAAFASKAALLVHDAFLDRQGAIENPDQAEVHCTASGAARIARDAGVKDLLLAHLNPAYEPARLERLLLEAASVFPRSHLASDLMTLKIGEGEEGAAGSGSAEASADSAAAGRPGD